MQNVTVKDGQCLFDIALLTTGKMEGVIDLAIANDMSITDDLTSGMQLKKTDLLDDEVVNQLLFLDARPASGDRVGTVVNEGIGYWTIGLDFKVS